MIADSGVLNHSEIRRKNEMNECEQTSKRHIRIRKARKRFETLADQAKDAAERQHWIKQAIAVKAQTQHAEARPHA